MQPPPSPRTPRPSRPQQSGSTIRGNINTAKRADQATSPLAQARTISQSLEDLVNIATNEAQHSSTEYERQAFQSQYNTDKSTPLRVTRQEMEQMQRDLRIACEVGQQLLKKNEELASSLEETENARERLVRLLEEERSDVEEKMRFEEVEKDRMRAQVKNLEEQVSKLKVEVRKTADVQGEAAVLRDRVSFLDGAHQRLEESLTSTNKELRTVSGERKNLMVTVQELYDQLTNFREINKNLKSSCQKQVGEYSDMMVKMQDEKLEMALQMKKMSEEITRYKRMVSESDTSSSTQLGENSWLTKSIQSIVNEVKMQGSTLVQQRESSDLEALKSALATAEAENQELNDLIQRQQDALQCHEEEHNALLSKLAEFERDSFLGNDERSGSGERLGIVSPRLLRSSLVRTGLTVNRKAEGVTLQNFNEETDGADGISVAAQLAKTIEEMEETARIFEQQLSIVEKLPPLDELLASRGTPDTGTKKMDRAVAESLPSAGSQASTRCTPDSPDYTKIPDELKREVALLRQRNLEVNAELSRQTIQIADLNWKIRDLESEKAAITERKETLEQEITVIRNAALQGKPLPPRSLEEDIQNDLDDLAFKLEESEKKFSQAKSRIEKLEKDNNQLHHSLSISESRALDLQGKLNQAHSQKAAFDRDVEAVLGVEKELSINPSTTSVHVYRSALVKSQSIIQRLTSDLAISNQDRARMRESITTLGAQLAKQASLLGEIEWRLKDADAQHSSAATRMALAEEAKNALEEELKDANEKMRSLALAARGSMIPMPASASASATGATLASLVETQKQFDQSLMAEARAKEDMIGRLQAEYDIVREELDSSKDEVDRLGHEISTLRNLLAEQKQTVGKAADRIMDAAKELHVDTVGERDDIRVKELEAQVQRLQIEKRVLNDSLTTLGAQLSLLSTKKGEDDWNIKEMVATKNQLAKANDDLKQEVLALSESLRVTEEKLNRMQARKDRSQPVSGNGRDIHEQLEEAKEKQEQLKAALRRYEQQADLDLQEIEDLRSKLTDMARENIQLAKQVDDVKAELSKVSISSTKIVSVGSDKFFSASDVVSKGFAASHETAESHEKARFYEAIIEDLETKLKIASGEIAKERSMTSLLKGQLRLVQESLQHLKRDDNRASRSERRSVDPADNDRSTSNAKCSQCVELQGRIRDILERNYSNIPDASAATAIPQNPPSSHTRNITGTTTSETTERTDRRIDELLDQLADLDIQLQQERCAAEHDRSTWDKERQDLEFKLDRARTVAEESKAALEVAQIEINNKKNVLLALKHAADAEKALKTNALNTSLSDAPDLGSCDFLASKLTKSSELELKIQSLLKDNLMLQEKRLFLENKVTEAEKENETIQKELHQAENLHVQHFLERASLSEKVAQLQREISIILSPPKDGQYIKDTKPNDKGKEKEKEKEKSSSFRRMSKLLPKSRRSSSSMEVTSEQLDEKLKALQAEKDNLEKEFHRNAQRVADAHAEAAGLKEKLLETERAFKVSKKEFKRKLEEADEFARATEANQNEVEECLKSQIQELTDRLMEPADSPPAAALLDDIIKHQTRIRDLEVKCDETAKRLFEADVQNENLLSQSKRLQSDFGALQSKYEVETSLLKNIIKAAHQMIENLETGNGDQAATAMEQLIAIRSEVDRFSHIITETEERWHQVSKQNVQLIRELSRTREELFSEQKRAREKSEELRGSINDLNAKGRTANELEKQIKEGRQRETTLQENIREMQLSMEKMKKSYEKDADMHTQRIKELERAIVNARLQVGSLGAELDKTKDEVQELTRHRKVLEISLIEREREFQESMNELKARQSVGIPKSLPAAQRSNLVPDIKITSESQEDNKFTTNEKMWELDLAKSKSQMLCWASWKLAQNVHSFTHHTDGGDQASVEVRAKMAVPPPPSPSEESTLAYVMILLAKAEEGVTAAGDDLASYMSKAGAEDSRWKNIEASLKSERDELKHRLNDLEHLLTDSQRRCTELEGEKVRVQSRAAAALAAQSESQQRLDEGRESRTDLQARVKSLMEERTSLRAKIEDQCTQIVNLEARIHTITTERSRSSTEAENLRDEIARVRVEMEELESMRKRRIQELESEVNKSCSSLARDEIRLMAAERELASARGEVAMLIAKVTDLTAEATRSLERYKEMCRSNGELERTLVTAKAELQARKQQSKNLN
ncbi:hypothetical protein BC829DRAFT_443467 [Chytridium lagenaria]|nr:hypothetical protein BC829DRAFT_443467 [Chytridium lagenaria]